MNHFQSWFMQSFKMIPNLNEITNFGLNPFPLRNFVIGRGHGLSAASYSSITNFLSFHSVFWYLFWRLSLRFQFSSTLHLPVICCLFIFSGVFSTRRLSGPTKLTQAPSWLRWLKTELLRCGARILLKINKSKKIFFLQKNTKKKSQFLP